MIYVSSSCVQSEKIGDSVKKLAQQGYKNIELSGGTQLYDQLEDDLLELQAKFNLNYLCHNYFPPPAKDFVLNLASLNQEIAQLSLDQVRTALRLSEKLVSNKYAFHAGFLIDIPLLQVGKSVEKREMFDAERALEQFKKNAQTISDEFPQIELYIENNVISNRNYLNYDRFNPFFLTSAEGLSLLDGLTAYKPLIDVAHLKVSAITLDLDLELELERFMAKTDYVHISDNNGMADTNGPFKSSSEMFDLLSKYDFSNKTITLEVYAQEDELRSSFENANRLVYG
jgi:sugar phosphate isomerase/epimerase